MTEPLLVDLLRWLPSRPEGRGAELRVVAGAVDGVQPGQRLVAWPGSPPVHRPIDPLLVPILGRGRLAGAPVWLEARPDGLLLCDLARDPAGDGTEIPEDAAAAALAQVAQGLLRLQAAGAGHGALDDATVLVDPAGRGWLLGCLGDGRAEEDLQAFRALVRARLPALGEAELPALVQALERRAPQPPRRLVEPPTVEALERLELWWEGGGPVDEVGFDLGSDEGERGLLDGWGGRTAPGEEPTGAAEATGDLGGGSEATTALLARLAAGLARGAPADRFARAEGQPSRALKALIADEPLDPLPVPEGLPLSGTGFLESGGHTDITTVSALRERDPEGERSPAPPALDPVEPGPGREREITARLLVLAVILALISGAMGTWLLLAP